VEAGQSDSQIDVLVDQCIQAKLKFSKWDREHPGTVVDSENTLRSSIANLFYALRLALQEKLETRTDSKSARLRASLKGWKHTARLTE